MLIKKRLQIHIAVSVTLAFVICLLLFLSLHRINTANNAGKIAGEIMTSILERVTLRNDYIRNPVARAREQWFAKHEQIGVLLKAASKNFRDAQDRKNIGLMIEDHESIGKIFSGIVTNREKHDLSSDSADLLRETEERLLSQLNMRVYDTVLHGRELLESSGEVRASAIRFAGGGIIAILLLLLAAALANSWTLGRAVTDRVRRLRDGSATIGDGNLDHRLDVTGDDEFAELSNAFNAMSAKLRNSYRHLETEVAERRRAEEALRKARDELEIRIEERTKELRVANEKARAERRRLFDVLETLPVYVVLLTADYHVPFANRSFRERFGESGGKRCYEYLFNRTEPCEICETYSVLKTNGPHRWNWTGSDGRDYEVYDFPLVDSDGSTLILEMGIDITERKRAEAALKEANETLERRVAENTAELRIANDALRSSRTAALNLMDDAVSARKRAEEKSEELGREIAERKRAEEALRRNERRYRSFVEVTSQFGWVTDANGLVVEDVSALRSFTGQTCEEAKGAGWAAALHPEDVQHTLEVWNRAVSAKTLYETEYRMMRHDGVYRLLLARGVPILDDEGNVVEWVGTCIDITEQKLAQEALRKAHAQLQEHAGRLQETNRELEGFSYTISHDLRAPLRAINGFARMLADDHGPSLDEEGKRLLGVIETNAVKMGMLIDDLLAFSRAGRTEMNVTGIDMNRLVAEVVETLMISESGAKAGIHVAALPPAPGDPALIRQVLTNLLENAVKFSGNRPDPRIEVGSFEKDGDRVYFVKDNGVGFDMKYYGKLFGVFQRLVTEKEFEGTGVGLAIVHRLVARHGGRVWAEARPGEGATFFFTLSRKDRENA